ncbi:MAG: hypothetical protein MAG794_00938 [Gammaproteobacteria bacterium]|nr:hypothetical protein [Gammaproteobacteria bacterium]
MNLLRRGLAIERLCRSSLSTTSGCSWASRLKGTTRRGPIAIPTPPPYRTSLSPPRPMACTSTASIINRQSPTMAPSGLTAGRPARTTAISVVVPPISATMMLSEPLRNDAPITLAAGPDMTVSTGLASAVFLLMSDPSPLTVLFRSSMPQDSSILSTASTSCRIKGIIRALTAAVRARLGASSALDNS